MIRVLIADDHELIRLGLTRILASEPDIEVCGVAGTGEAAVELAQVCGPDVVLLDLTMPGAGGIAAAARIRLADPHVRVMVVSCHDDAAHVRDAIEAGATAYLLKVPHRWSPPCARSTVARCG
jgi:DNA-binding NarL/FixJ family response regulator